MSPTILTIASSPLGERSVTRQLTEKIIGRLQREFPESVVVTRDLAASPLPHIDGLLVGSMFTRPDQRDATLQEAIKASDEAVDELLAADIIVIGAPMYNFGIPSSLKAWIDHVVRMGRTFTNGAMGPEGLLTDKKTIVASARGQVYTTGQFQAMDHQENYLKTTLGFIGLTNISFVRAEGLLGGEVAAKEAMSVADRQIEDAIDHVRGAVAVRSARTTAGRV